MKDSDDQPWLEQDRRPDGVSDDTVEAIGKLGEALEWLERARGRLYDFHQMSGRVDLLMGEAAEELTSAGHSEQAQRLRDSIVGRNVIEGRWSFQIVEEYDATYWEPLREFCAEVRADLVDGKDHVYESEMKEDRRSQGRRHHESRPESGQ